MTDDQSPVSTVPEFMAAEPIGEMILDMANRLATADKVVPGTVARWGFAMDGTRYEIAMTVRRG